MKRILVIRLGALGDFVLSFPAFAAIRAHHTHDRVSLLTTAPFAALAAQSPWFDSVLVDPRPGWTDLAGLWRLRRQLLGFGFVYDLQTSGRSSRYRLLAGRPPWSGVALGCSHPHRNPARNDFHTIERQREQLADAGVTKTPSPDLSWLARGGPVLDPPYALLVPGTSLAHGGAKRWPAARYGELARLLADRGVLPVVIGGEGDRDAAALVQAACAIARDLTGKTSLQDLAGLAARSSLVVGGDTGPVHLAAAMGCRVVALFSEYSNPALAAPRGDVVIVEAARLHELSVAEVWQKMGFGDLSPMGSKGKALGLPFGVVSCPR